jgi:hypothetical protein
MRIAEEDDQSDAESAREVTVAALTGPIDLLPAILVEHGPRR